MPGQDEARSFILELLRNRNLPGILEWAGENRNALSVLSSFIYEKEDLARWRAIEAMGRVAASEAERDLESVRKIIRRLLWSMNDDSGSVGWHAPEAIGEILYNAPELMGEFGIILASFLRKAPFQRGVHWAIWRMACKKPEIFMELTDDLTASLSESDPYIVLYAVKALDIIGAKRPVELPEYSKSETIITEYNFNTGTLEENTVGRLLNSETVRRE